MNKINEFDLVVIGGGSGGVRAARIAAFHGAKVALCEKDRMGGTCVITGVFQKNIILLSSTSEFIDNSSAYGWSIKNIKKNFSKLIKTKTKS